MNTIYDCQGIPEYNIGQSTDHAGSRDTVVVRNPDAGRSGGDLESVLAVFRGARGKVYEHSLRGDPAQDRRRVRELRARCGRLVVAGGDGTLHHLLPALIGDGAPVGVLPLGTANDFARGLGIPTDLHAAAAAIRDGVPALIDLAAVNGEYFANAAHIGLGAAAGEAVDAGAKRRWRALSYPLGLLRRLRNQRPFRVRLAVDGRERRFRVIHIGVGNGGYFGGGVPVSPDADIRDGLLHVYVVQARPPHEVLRAAVGVWRGERRAPAVWRGSGEAIEVHTRRSRPITADGEPSGRTPAAFSIHPAILPVIMPARGTDTDDSQ